MIDAQPTLTRDFLALDSLEGALDWWREAGVDCDFADEASGWLATPEPDDAVAAPPPSPPPQPREPSPLERALSPAATPVIGGDRANWPHTLEKFREWWMTEASLDDGALDRRIPPRGVAQASLMVLVGQPESDDSDGLLTGAGGKMLAAMLRAMGLQIHETYLASALAAPRAMPDWAALGAAGLGEVARHHVALAAPARVLAVGRAQMALFGIDAARAREPLMLDCGGKEFPVLAIPDFADLARSAGRRQNFWQRWLDWTR